MSKQIPFISEIVSLTVMLLMIVALVAGQADATLNDAQAADTSFSIALAPERPEASAATLVRATFDLEPLTITIDASAEIRRLVPDAN